MGQVWDKFFPRQRLGLGLGLLLLAWGLLLTWGPRSAVIPTEVLQISRHSAQVLVGRLYNPPQTPAPYPTVMLWHGVNCTKETLEPWAIALAEQGLAVLTFDAGGFGESYRRAYSEEENLADARAIAAYVYAHPERFDPRRIGVGGHSMGGATALFLAREDSHIKTAIVLGMSADIDRVSPPNLFMGIGLYEQFHTPKAMRSMLRQGTEPSAQASQQYGAFAKGTARKLVISPTSDHLVEPFDPTLIRESAAWARQVFAIKTPMLAPISSELLLSPFLIGLGSILSISYGIRCGIRYESGAEGQNNTDRRKQRRWMVYGLTAIVPLMLALGMVGQFPPQLTTDGVLLAAIVLPITHFAIAQPAQLTPWFRLVGLYVVIIVWAYTVVLVVLRLPELMAQPGLILGLPQFMLQLPISLMYSRMQEVRALLFPIHSYGVMPSWGLLLLFLPDLVKPGIVVQGSVNAAIWAARWLRQPLQIQWRTGFSRRSGLLLGGLVVLLIGILYQQAQAGAFSVDYVGSAVKLLVQMVLLPGLLIVGVMRSPWLQNLERRCWQV